MHLKQLEIVLQVARLGSLSRAASAMGLAQSIISRQVGQLELAWGDRIFERTGRGMALSDFGQRVLPEIEALLDQAARLDDAVRGVAGVATGIVRIGVVPSLANSVMPELISDLHRTAPGVRLSIAESLSGYLDELLVAGRIDLAVINRFGHVSPDEDLLGEVPTYLVCDPGHPLARSPTVPFAQLAGIPLVVPSAPSGLRNILDHNARRLCIPLQIYMEAESLSVMKRVAMSGDAATILPRGAVTTEIEQGLLAITEIVEPRLPRLIALASTRQHALSRAARAVMTRMRLVVPGLLHEDALQAE